MNKISSPQYTKKGIVALCCGLLASLMVIASDAKGADLTVTYGAAGLQTLTYGGFQLANYGTDPNDSFVLESIWYRKPDNSTAEWKFGNPGTSVSVVMSYLQNKVSWVTDLGVVVSCQYQQTGDKLLCTVNVQNDGPNTVLGVNCRPMKFHFGAMPPELPLDRVHLGWSYQGPVAVRASFDSGQKVVVVTDETITKDTFVGLHTAWPGGSEYYFYASSYLFWVPGDFPMLQTPVAAGTSYNYTVAARFAPSATPTKDIVADLYTSYNAAYPYILKWNDRRAIAQVFLASYGSGVSGDPRGWIFYDPAVDGDISTTTGKANFRTRLLSHAAGVVTRAQAMNAQGVITWDIEGQEWWHPISYIGDPTQAEVFAPEMAYKPTPSDLSTIDAYFKVYTDAGLTPGVTIRPQTVVRTVSGSTVTVQQVETSGTSSPTFQQNIINKAQYAKSRWGCRIFYTDSNVIDNNLGDPPPVYEAALAAVPDVLFIPEWSRVRTYTATAPYGIITPAESFARLGTPQEVLDVYPKAFCAMSEGPNSLAATIPSETYYENNRTTLVQSLRRGDILMYHGWWDSPVGAKIKSIYDDAGLVAVSNGSYNGGFELDLDGNGSADGWNRMRENSVAAADGTYYVRASVNTATDGNFLNYGYTWTDVNRTVNIPFKYTADTAPIKLSAKIRDTANAQFDSYQFYMEISWKESGTTYTAGTYHGWASTGAKNTSNWRQLEWSAPISGLSSNGHSIANGTDHRITFLQLRCADATSTQANTVYEMLVDDFAVSYAPVLTNNSGYNGGFETDGNTDGLADGWNMMRFNSVPASEGSYYIAPSVNTATDGTFLSWGFTFTDVYRTVNIPFTYSGTSSIALAVDVRDTANAQFDSYQFYIEVSWEESGVTYTASTYHNWASTGTKNTTGWRTLQWNAAMSGLSSSGHSIASGSNHRITFLQLRCADGTSTQANTVYEMLVDNFRATPSS